MQIIDQQYIVDEKDIQNLILEFFLFKRRFRRDANLIEYKLKRVL